MTENLSFRFVIPSKNRSDTIKDEALRLFPDATVCVSQEEVEAYRSVCPELLVHPNDVTGIAPVFQWILDHVKEKAVVIISDDVRIVYDQTGFHKRRIEDPLKVMAIVERLAITAMEAGCRVFGFTQHSRPISYAGFEPFSLHTWTGGVIGIVGREVRYDTSLRLRADIDFCLQSLLRDRIVLIDNRYVFVHDRWKKPGGNSVNKSRERHEYEMKYLKRKWGAHLRIKRMKGDYRLSLHVPR